MLQGACLPIFLSLRARRNTSDRLMGQQVAVPAAQLLAVSAGDGFGLQGLGRCKGIERT